MFCKKGALRNFAKFTGKDLCQILFLNKVSGLAKFLKGFFLQNTSTRLLLSFYKKILRNSKNVRQTKVQKRFIYGEKKEIMEQKETNANASYLTEGLAATDKVKAVGWFCRGAPSLMFDEILNATLSEKLSITGVTQENLELPLPPISLDSHQTQNKMKFWTDPTFLLP